MSNAFDTSNAPKTEPVEITAGDYTCWQRPDLLTDYPSNLYSLKYECRSEGVPARKITINADTDYLVELASATTAAYTVANYHWTAYIVRTSDSARVSIDSGIFKVNPDHANSSTDPRSLAEKMVASIQAALEFRADNHQLDVLAYSLGVDASATRDPAKLLEHRSYWLRELNRQNQRARARKGQSHSGTIGVKF